MDKWLWQARFFKTRSLAARIVSDGQVRLNSVRVTRPAQLVAIDDVLTFPQGAQIRVVRVSAIGTRRGPATEARTLFCDLTPPATDESRVGRVGERPTKRDRRLIDEFRKGQDEAF
ncbi:RNA-binding S4 domain-containing protein [Pontibaca sp. S1109L]|uniref:RNA-binding S4 domain-containing protein n=1 Tax=Pontibaca salina TaxID=2795731 RepID=A0A934HTC3_9RHOB|nr:RNA-binding S4 domain-containing protein [Pontibaca salina]